MRRDFELRPKSISEKKAQLFVLAAALSLTACRPATTAFETLIQPPAGDRYCQLNPQGESVIPNGRLLRPMGNTVRIAPHPYGLALSPDGSVAVTANSGNRPFSITILENPASGRPAVRQVPEGPMNDPNLLEDVFMGLAVTPDNRSVWVSGGSANKLFRFDLRSGVKVDSILCAQADNPDGYLGDLVLSRDGNTLYVCDQSNFRLLVADARTRTVRHYVPVGRYACAAPG